MNTTVLRDDACVIGDMVRYWRAMQADPLFTFHRAGVRLTHIRSWIMPLC